MSLLYKSLTKRVRNFGHADNIMTFFLILMEWALYMECFNSCSEQRPEEEKEAYYWFAQVFGITFNSAIAIGVSKKVMFAPLKVAEARHVLMIFIKYPLTYYIYQ